MINSFRMTVTPAFLKPRTGFAWRLLIALIIFLAGSPLLMAQTQSLSERFSYNGSAFFQGFYLARDLPLTTQTSDPCPSVDSTGSLAGSRCREERDFYRMRLRLNLSFRPSRHVDILYGLEVGYLTFGEDDASKSGPGTGGQGSGRTNLETREFRIRFRNSADSLHLNLGVFPVGTPQGIVLATSGAGARAVWDLRAYNSILDLTHIRSIDNSKIDDDSNGFSDDNFARINLTIFKWKYSGWRSLKLENYIVNRRDRDGSANDTTDTNSERSTLYWGGMYAKFKKGRWKTILHLVGNWGKFDRPYRLQPPISYWLGTLLPDLNTAYNNYLATEASLQDHQKYRRTYKVAAGAGTFELAYRLTDIVEIAAAAAAGSGRLGVDPDGRAVDLRKDQFRVAGSGFQFSEIGVDSSGGYSLFADGKLTGIVERGLLLRTRLLSNLQVELGYFALFLYRSPTIEGNTFYVRYLDTDRVSNYLGQEFNAKFTWQALSGLKVTAKAAYFNAGSGYKILRDIEFGDQIAEISLAVKQTF